MATCMLKAAEQRVAHRVILAGYEHNDRVNGIGKLRDMYQWLGPSVLINPISKQAEQNVYDWIHNLAMMKENLIEESDQKTLDRILAIMPEVEIPFPVRVNNQYGNANFLPVHYTQNSERPLTTVDSQSVSGDIIFQVIHRLFEPQTIEAYFAQHNKQPTAGELKEMWGEALAGRGKLEAVADRIMGYHHDAIAMENTLKQVLSEQTSLRPQTIVYTVPMHHLADSPLKTTLYSRVKEIGALRIPLLYEAFPMTTPNL